MKEAILKMVVFLFAASLISFQANAQVNLLDASAHPKFVNPLPIPAKIDATKGGTIAMQMNETTQWLGLVDGALNPLPTTVWGYGQVGQPVTFPGPTFVAKSNVAVNVTWDNNLPNRHLLPVDPTLHMAGPHHSNGDPPSAEEVAAFYVAGNIPTVVHLHGGNTESASDGLPEAWYTQNFTHVGAHFVKETYTFHNTQEAATLWYHDHALGITRLNVYAGLAGFYLLEDNRERKLMVNGVLPKGPQDIEIVIQDRMFTDDGQLFLPSKDGDSFFDGTLDADELGGIEPSVVAEFFGDFIVVNGMAWPKLEVEPRQYRFRLLNGSDSRFYALRLDNEESFLQIATDDGLLPNVVPVTQLILAPGERAEVVVDFTGKLGDNIVLENYGPDEPFKGNNFKSSADGPTGQIMEFRVTKRLKAPKGRPETTLVDGDYLRPPLENLGPATTIRKLALFEGMDADDRLQPLLGVVNGDNPKDYSDPNNPSLNGSLAWFEKITENPGLNNVEEWWVYNNTEDAHPIHLHLVSFQILGRATFTAVDEEQAQVQHNSIPGVPKSYGTGGYILESSILEDPLVAAAANERGWKDTFIVPPGMVGKIIAKFNRPGRYVWHCHILSHEDHEMMRPFQVGPIPAAPPPGSTKGASVVDQVEPDQFGEFRLYPNPASDRTKVDFVLAEGADVRVSIYGMDGRMINSEELGYLNDGLQTIEVPLGHLDNGMYIFELKAGNKQFRESIIVSK